MDLLKQSYSPRSYSLQHRLASRSWPVSNVHGWVFLILSGLILANSGHAFAQALPSGFQRLQGKYVDVITDLPLDDELRALPSLFDAAMPLWCAEFDMQLDEVKNWHVEAFVMLARERFKSAGFIPEKIPEFRYGFQYGNQVWVVEQPSPYYRRHLLLHEGTHWFMNRKFGDHGPPWLMEGAAELLGTHRWDGKSLQLGLIPKSKTEVEYWGRISLIQQQLADGVAPSLEEILRYDNTAHQNVEAYAWSWAAVLFLRNHPDTSQAFADLHKQPMKSDGTLTRWLFRRLQSRWPQIRREWSAMLTELEYGYDPSRGMLMMTRLVKPLADQPIELEVAADRSWQAANFQVTEGDQLIIEASGTCFVGQEPKPWPCKAAGVTLEYYRGEPLGRLMMTIASPLTKEQFSQPIEVISVGDRLEWTATATGELNFRLNESNAGLADNSGSLTVTIRKASGRGTP